MRLGVVAFGNSVGSTVAPGGGGGGGGGADTTARSAVPVLPSLEARVTVAPAARAAPRPALAVVPSRGAVMTVAPAASAVPRPEPEIVATLTTVDVQATGRPVRMLLLESRVVATACVVPSALGGLAAGTE